MTTLTTSLEIAKLALAYCGVTEAIDAIDADASVEDRMANLFYAPTRDELLELYPWSHAVEHRPLVLTAGYYEYNQEYTKTADTITNATQANPCVITTAADNMVTGDYGKIYDVGGMTELNRTDPFYLTRASANSLQLTGIDSSTWTAYTSGGSIVKLEPLSKYQNGLVYDLPDDYAYGIALEGNYDWELKGFDGTLKLLCTLDDAVLRYIKNDITDVAKWKNTFINALVLKLAMKLAIPIVGIEKGMALLTKLAQWYATAENEALLLQALDKKVTRETRDPWITARGGV